MDRRAEYLLRTGVAFALLYPAVSALVSPDLWIGYIPSFLRGLAPDIILLHAFGLSEAILAFWILFCKRIHIPALVTSALLVTIVIIHRDDFVVLFRDLSLALASGALALENFFKHRDHDRSS